MTFLQLTEMGSGKEREGCGFKPRRRRERGSEEVVLYPWAQRMCGKGGDGKIKKLCVSKQEGKGKIHEEVTHSDLRQR